MALSEPEVLDSRFSQPFPAFPSLSQWSVVYPNIFFWGPSSTPSSCHWSSDAIISITFTEGMLLCNSSAATEIDDCLFIGTKHWLLTVSEAVVYLSIVKSFGIIIDSTLSMHPTSPPWSKVVSFDAFLYLFYKQETSTWSYITLELDKCSSDRFGLLACSMWKDFI